MFDISSIQYNSVNPTFIGILFTVICSMALGTLLAFTYDKTSKEVDRPNHFLQAMVLVTIVAATIIQAIGDSVARGLGMLGALSIIRFRTTVRDPRNIVFMFGAIASGIACGVFGFLIAIVGTVAFCITAFILRFSSFHKSNPLIGILRIEVPKAYDDIMQMEDTISKFSLRFGLNSYKIFTGSKKENLMLYEYKLKLKEAKRGEVLMTELAKFADVKVVALEFKDNTFETI